MENFSLTECLKAFLSWVFFDINKGRRAEPMAFIKLFLSQPLWQLAPMALMYLDHSCKEAGSLQQGCMSC